MNKKDIIHHIRSFQQAHHDGVVVIRGATATGKTSLSIQIGHVLPIEIISADSRQIYQYMDVGTDKISKEQQQGIPHHMLDIVTPDQTYTAGQWKQAVEELIPTIHARGNIPVIVGGTGLYIDMIYKNFSMPEVAPDRVWREQQMQQEKQYPGYLRNKLQEIDPTEANKHHPHSTRYILRAYEIYEKTGSTKTALAQEYPVQRPLLMLGLRREKEDTNKRINARIKDMLTTGKLVAEVQSLLDRGYTIEHTAMNGIGYKEILNYLEGAYDKERAEELLKRNSHRYAKRQRSWFRRYIAESIHMPKERVHYLLCKCSNQHIK